MGKLVRLAIVPAVALAMGGAGAAQAHESHHHHHHHKGKHGVCGEDKTWLKTAIQGDRFEIAGGTLALQKSSNTKVRTLAQTLVADHTKSLAETSALAKKLGVDVPDSPSPTQQWQLKVVATFSGATFDRWYSELEVADHVQDIDETKDEVETGCNPLVRHDARDEIPVLQKHLKLAQDALASTSP